MGQLKTKFIQDDAVTADKVKLGNDSFLRGRNNADSADIDIIKVNASDKIVFGSNPQHNADPVNNDDLSRKSYVDDGLALKEDVADKGAANGYCPLNASSKIDASYLPASAMEYKGAWAASTNTPTLANGTGDTGDMYKASDAGSVDFGAGSISFVAGDAVIYSGTIWEKIPGADLVTSVAGKQGAVTLDTDDVSEGTNLYYTDARAKAAAVDDTAYGAGWNGVTDVAPSKNAVYDKIETIGAAVVSDAVYGVAWDGDTTTAASKNAIYDKVEAMIDDTAYGVGWDGSTNVAPSQNAVYDKIESLVLTDPGKDDFTLNGTDITNQYVDLTGVALAGSIHFYVEGGGLMREGADYTVNLTGGAGGNTRLTFSGVLATAGAAALESGDILQIKYLK